MSIEVQYLLVVVGLFIVPRLLQRLRIPSAISCVGIGAAMGIGFGLFHGDTTIPLLATLGIVSLFLFAGLEVDFGDLRRGWRITVGHLIVQGCLLALAAFVAGRVFSLTWRPALLFALAITTPSTGFILDSLPGFGLTSEQQFWVKTKAISSELLSLVALFVAIQSTSAKSLTVSSIVLVSMVAILPSIFQLFVSRILPFAPKSEFGFLMVLALLCAYLTRHLGVYYLVGAFVVGITAVRLRERLPQLASDHLLVGIELFASFFIPFYFFKAGLHLNPSYFGWRSLLIGLALVLIAVPVRIGLVAVFRSLALHEPMRDGARVGLSLVPTMVFTLVLAEILLERYQLSAQLFGALVVFALVNTAIPGFILRALPEFDAPTAPRVSLDHGRSEGGSHAAVVEIGKVELPRDV